MELTRSAGYRGLFPGLVSSRFKGTDTAVVVVATATVAAAAAATATAAMAVVVLIVVVTVPVVMVALVVVLMVVVVVVALRRAVSRRSGKKKGIRVRAHAPASNCSDQSCVRGSPHASCAVVARFPSVRLSRSLTDDFSSVPLRVPSIDLCGRARRFVRLARRRRPSIQRGRDRSFIR